MGGVSGMKLCVLGPVNTVSRTAGIIQEAFPELQISVVSYCVYTDVLNMIDEIQQDADVLLFPGKAAYALCEKNKSPVIPWEYIPRHTSSLLRALVEVQHRYKKDICRISYDTLSPELIHATYEEIGIGSADLRIAVAEQRLLAPTYLDYLVKFHTDHYYHGGASCCITGLTEISNHLKQLGIPCVLTLPTRTLIIDTVKRLQLRYLAQQNSKNSIVIISVEIGFSGEYSILGKDDYAYISNRIKVLECIYQFSYRIDGVVVENSNRSFLIFTTRSAIELETEGFKNLYLLDMLDTCRAENVSVGIGYGNTASEAKFNAFDAMEMARKTKKNCAYVIRENGSVLSPLKPSRKKDSYDDLIDKELLKLSEQTGLSVNTLYALWSKTQKSMRSEFTSRELASICGFSVRTMDRILQKLLTAGCCKVLGMRITGEHGRPSRIFNFSWFQQA